MYEEIAKEIAQFWGFNVDDRKESVDEFTENLELNYVIRRRNKDEIVLDFTERELDFIFDLVNKECSDKEVELPFQIRAKILSQWDNRTPKQKHESRQKAEILIQDTSKNLNDERLSCHTGEPLPR
jgi:hypothetical protein